MMIDQQIEQLLADLRVLQSEANDHAFSVVQDRIAEFSEDARAVFEAIRANRTTAREDLQRNRNTQQAYLRVIQEFIASKGDPDLSMLSREIGMLQAQATSMNGDIMRVLEYCRRLDRKRLSPDAQGLLDQLEFSLFHELHRKVDYVERYVVRDLRLALAGLSDKSFRGGLGERPEAPVKVEEA